MHAITSKFIYVALAWVIIFALAQVFYYFKFKRKTNLTDVDKSLWQIRLDSVFLGALLCVAMLYLPTTGFLPRVDISPAAREAAFQNLVHNQERIGNQLDELQDVLYIVFMALMMYLFGVVTVIGRVRNDRHKHASENDPSVNKPLGLET